MLILHIFSSILCDLQFTHISMLPSASGMIHDESRSV